MTRLVLLLLLLAAAASGINVTELQPEGFISDFARVVDPVTKQDLERYCAQVQKATGAQLAVVTLRSIEGQPIEDFANDVYRHFGIGQKGVDEGALLLLVIDDRLSRLEVGRGLEPIITDGTAGELLRAMRPALVGGRYGEALGTALDSLGRRIAQAKGVTLDTGPPRQRVPEAQQPSGIPWAFLLFILFLLAILPRGGGRGGRYRGGGGGGILPALILGSMMRRHGGHSHGGFGGYDSSGGFGGFGGGDSGGGGASSSW